MKERIKYNTILDGTNDEGVIHLPINMKCATIVVDTVSPV